MAGNNMIPVPREVLEGWRDCFLRTRATLRHYEIQDGGHEAFCQRIENEKALTAIDKILEKNDE